MRVVTKSANCAVHVHVCALDPKDGWPEHVAQHCGLARQAWLLQPFWATVQGLSFPRLELSLLCCVKGPKEANEDASSHQLELSPRPIRLFLVHFFSPANKNNTRSCSAACRVPGKRCECLAAGGTWCSTWTSPSLSPTTTPAQQTFQRYLINPYNRLIYRFAESRVTCRLHAEECEDHWSGCCC